MTEGLPNVAQNGPIGSEVSVMIGKNAYDQNHSKSRLVLSVVQNAFTSTSEFRTLLFLKRSFNVLETTNLLFPNQTKPGLMM